MRKNTKVLGTVAVAGLVAAAGSAFTGGGLTYNQADSFVGGTVTQSVTGATLTSMSYDWADAAHRQMNKVDLDFAGGEELDGRLVSIQVASGNSVQTFSCSPIATVDQTSICEFPGQSDVTSVSVTVSTEKDNSSN